MTEPRIKIITNREFKKRTGLKRGGYALGNTIYQTKDAGQFVVEHEKAHVKLGHQPAKLTGTQFIRRELKADKEAVKKTGMKRYPKYYLDDIVNDTSNRFSSPKSEVRPIVIREAKKLRLI